MTVPSSNTPERSNAGRDQSLITWLRRRIGGMKTLSVLSALALGGLGIGAVSFQPKPLTADQFGYPTATTTDSGPVIVPRGADAGSQSVPNPRVQQPRNWSPSARSQPSWTPSRQASLGQPVFEQRHSPIEKTPGPAEPSGFVRRDHVIPASTGAPASVSPTHRVPANGSPVSAAPLSGKAPAGTMMKPFDFSHIPYAGGSPQDAEKPSTPIPPVPEGSFHLPSETGAAQMSPGVPQADYGNPSDVIEEGPPATQLSDPNPQASSADGAASPGAVRMPESRVGDGTGPGHSGLRGRPLAGGVAPGMSGFRANVESDAQGWIGPYMGRTDSMPVDAETVPAPRPAVELPPDFTAWWDPLVQQQAGIAQRSLAVDVSTLVQMALTHSPRVQVLQANPEVEYRAIQQEEAAFDWRAFLDTKYDDLNDPIGNKLTTGNLSGRFVNQQTSGTTGIKRRTGSGGELEIAQKFGTQKNNSQYLIPNPQATSRLELSFRQPLLNQAGTVYNQSQIVLARINANSSGDETLEELQNHLFSVAEAYWKLYRARAEFFQRQRLLTSARDVLSTLEARNQVDTIPRQILRARAAVARAESRMQRAVTDIRNAESELRLLVNDPQMLDGGPAEFMPTESPSTIESPVGLRDSLQTALVNRPDISRAIRQMRASGVRLGVSKKDILPKLDFIVSTYVAGLDSQYRTQDSFGNQFSQGRPGYTVGMEFEVPIGNRAAKAKLEQRQWELRRAINGFRATVEASLTEVEIANREVETAYRELLGKYQAMEAARNEVAYLQDRFAVLPMVEESSMLLLEDLLDGYERLADEEAAFALSQVNYALSIIQLRRATGVLMRSRYDAPQLEASESEWMASRAEQAAADADALIIQNDGEIDRAVYPDQPETAETAATGQVHAPVSWTQPIGTRPGARPARKAPARPGIRNSNSPVSESNVGGHSFGSD
ncbi:MAG: TolC family protein [Planctomycetota bacterium]